jgi:hypothetical protein
MSLWSAWWDAIWMLRPAFTRLRPFMWFATLVAGLCLRTERFGVTSIVRALGLQPRLYDNLLDCCHSSAIELDRLAALWFRTVLWLWPTPVVVNGRHVLGGDGIKIPKSGQKMPGVKWLHQESEANTKPTYIRGHSLQAVSLLVEAAHSVLAVPLIVRIHEGVVWSNRDRRTLLDKMQSLLGLLASDEPFYFVADAFYAAGKTVTGLRADHHHLITRVRTNAVAYEPYRHHGPNKRGRPRIYGRKIKLRSLFSNASAFVSIPSPVYGEANITLAYHVRDLLWRPAGRLVRFVVVSHPSRGRCILMSTDVSLSAREIIRLYGLRFKIEYSFKQAVHQIGTFSYPFWMRDMKPLRRRHKNQTRHRESLAYRNGVKRKLHAYHVFMAAGVVAQGLLQYLAVVFPEQVWNSFGSWLRTIRPGIPASEWVVAAALRNRLPEFLLRCAQTHCWAKFIHERQDPDRMPLFRLVA